MIVYLEGMLNPRCDFVFSDVDPPRDLRAINVQTDGATLTWKPPQAAVTGYTLTFDSADGVIRVCTLLTTLRVLGLNKYNFRLHKLTVTEVFQSTPSGVGFISYILGSYCFSSHLPLKDTVIITQRKAEHICTKVSIMIQETSDIL